MGTTVLNVDKHLKSFSELDESFSKYNIDFYGFLFCVASGSLCHLFVNNESENMYYSTTDKL